MRDIAAFMEYDPPPDEIVFYSETGTASSLGSGNSASIPQHPPCRMFSLGELFACAANSTDTISTTSPPATKMVMDETSIQGDQSDQQRRILIDPEASQLQSTSPAPPCQQAQSRLRRSTWENIDYTESSEGVEGEEKPVSSVGALLGVATSSNPSPFLNANRLGMDRNRVYVPRREAANSSPPADLVPIIEAMSISFEQRLSFFENEATFVNGTLVPVTTDSPSTSPTHDVGDPATCTSKDPLMKKCTEGEDKSNEVVTAVDERRDETAVSDSQRLDIGPPSANAIPSLDDASKRSLEDPSPSSDQERTKSTSASVHPPSNIEGPLHAASYKEKQTALDAIESPSLESLPAGADPQQPPPVAVVTQSPAEIVKDRDCTTTITRENILDAQERQQRGKPNRTFTETTHLVAKNLKKLQRGGVTKPGALVRVAFRQDTNAISPANPPLVSDEMVVQAAASEQEHTDQTSLQSIPEQDEAEDAGLDAPSDTTSLSAATEGGPTQGGPTEEASATKIVSVNESAAPEETPPQSQDGKPLSNELPSVEVPPLGVRGTGDEANAPNESCSMGEPTLVDKAPLQYKQRTDVDSKLTDDFPRQVSRNCVPSNHSPPIENAGQQQQSTCSDQRRKQSEFNRDGVVALSEPVLVEDFPDDEELPCERGGSPARLHLSAGIFPVAEDFLIPKNIISEREVADDANLLPTNHVALARVEAKSPRQATYARRSAPSETSTSKELVISSTDEEFPLDETDAVAMGRDPCCPERYSHPAHGGFSDLKPTSTASTLPRNQRVACHANIPNGPVFPLVMSQSLRRALDRMNLDPQPSDERSEGSNDVAIDNADMETLGINGTLEDDVLDPRSSLEEPGLPVQSTLESVPGASHQCEVPTSQTRKDSVEEVTGGQDVDHDRNTGNRTSNYSSAVDTDKWVSVSRETMLPDEWKTITPKSSCDSISITDKWKDLLQDSSGSSDSQDGLQDSRGSSDSQDGSYSEPKEEASDFESRLLPMNPVKNPSTSLGRLPSSVDQQSEEKTSMDVDSEDVNSNHVQEPSPSLDEQNEAEQKTATEQQIFERNLVEGPQASIDRSTLSGSSFPSSEVHSFVDEGDQQSERSGESNYFRKDVIREKFYKNHGIVHIHKSTSISPFTVEGRDEIEIHATTTSSEEDDRTTGDLSTLLMERISISIASKSGSSKSSKEMEPMTTSIAIEGLSEIDGKLPLKWGVPAELTSAAYEVSLLDNLQGTTSDENASISEGRIHGIDTVNGLTNLANRASPGEVMSSAFAMSLRDDEATTQIDDASSRELASEEGGMSLKSYMGLALPSCENLKFLLC